MPRAENFGDLITADHKILREESESRNNHRYAVVVQDLATQWVQSYPCETKSSKETQKNLMKFLEPTRKPKVIFTDNYLEFGKSCEDLSWNHCTSTPHRSETNGIAERNQCAELRKGHLRYCCTQVWMKNWWADSMECYCYLQNIQDLLSDGKTPYERRFGEPFEGPIIPLGAMVEYHTISAKDISRLHQFGPKVLPGIFLGYVLYAGGIWKGDVMIADIEEWRRWTRLNSARRLNAKEVLTPMKGDNFSQSQMEQQNPWRRSTSETLIRDRPERGEEQEVFRGESDGLSSPNPVQDDSTRDDEEAKNDFWSITGDFVYRHHVEPRVKLYMPKEESFPVPLKYIDVTRNTSTSFDVLLKNISMITGTWMEKRELSDAWTNFTRFLLLFERPPDGKTWSGRRLTWKQTTSRPDNVWPDMWKHAAKSKAKQKWAIEKPKLDNAMQLRGIFFIEPDDEDFKHTMKKSS